MTVKFTSSAKDPSARTVRVSPAHARPFSRLGRGEADRLSSSLVPGGMGTSHSTSDWRCLPEVGTSRRVPRPPTPAEAQPCHTRCAEGRGRIHASSHPRSLVECDYWALRGCKSSGQQFSASWLMRSCLHRLNRTWRVIQESSLISGFRRLHRLCHDQDRCGLLSKAAEPCSRKQFPCIDTSF